MRALLITGRVVFGGFFLYSGINHFLNREAMAGYAASKNLPLPGESVLGSGALLSAAGASIMLGVSPKLAGASIAAFLLIASPLFHDFWNEEDGQASQNQMIHFSKNLALLGAALMIAAKEDL